MFYLVLLKYILFHLKSIFNISVQMQKCDSSGEKCKADVCLWKNGQIFDSNEGKSLAWRPFLFWKCCLVVQSNRKSQNRTGSRLWCQSQTKAAVSLGLSNLGSLKAWTPFSVRFFLSSGSDFYPVLHLFQR